MVSKKKITIKLPKQNGDSQKNKIQKTKANVKIRDKLIYTKSKNLKKLNYQLNNKESENTKINNNNQSYKKPKNNVLQNKKIKCDFQQNKTKEKSIQKIKIDEQQTNKTKSNTLQNNKGKDDEQQKKQLNNIQQNNKTKSNPIKNNKIKVNNQKYKKLTYNNNNIQQNNKNNILKYIERKIINGKIQNNKINSNQNIENVTKNGAEGKTSKNAELFKEDNTSENNSLYLETLFSSERETSACANSVTNSSGSNKQAEENFFDCREELVVNSGEKVVNCTEPREKSKENYISTNTEENFINFKKKSVIKKPKKQAVEEENLNVIYDTIEKFINPKEKKNYFNHRLGKALKLWKNKFEKIFREEQIKINRYELNDPCISALLDINLKPDNWISSLVVKMTKSDDIFEQFFTRGK